MVEDCTGLCINAQCINGLVSFWRFEGSANDEMGKNDGTIIGAEWAEGKSGQALEFDVANNDRVTVSSPSNLPTGNHTTVIAWIKPDTTQDDPDYNGIFSYGSRYCDYTSLVLAINEDGVPVLDTWCNSFWADSLNVNFDSWNFIAGVVNESSVILYVNEQKETGTFSNPPNINTGLLNIGATDDNPGGRNFNGIIDEVMIFNRSLGESEIQEIYGYFIGA